VANSSLLVTKRFKNFIGFNFREFNFFFAFYSPLVRLRPRQINKSPKGSFILGSAKKKAK